MHDGAYKVEAITAVAALQAIVPEWERLAEQSGSSFFMRPSWFLSWAAQIQPQSSPLILTVRRSGALVAVVPLCVPPPRWRFRALAFGGADLVCGEYLSVVCAPEERRQAVGAALDWLRNKDVRWDLMRLSAVAASDSLTAELRRWSSDSQFSFLKVEESVCPYIQLPRSFDEYLSTFSGKRRKHLTRALRRLEETGMSVKAYKAGSELHEALDALIRLHTLRWTSLGASGTLGGPGFREFLHAVAAREASRLPMRLYLLEAAGTPVAAMLNFHSGGTALQYQSGFDPASPIAAYSPGTILVLFAIRRAIEEGLSEYDFLRGAEQYKFHFANQWRRTETIFVGRTLLGKAYVLAKNARSRLSRLRTGSTAEFLKAQPGPDPEVKELSVLKPGFDPQ